MVLSLARIWVFLPDFSLSSCLCAHGLFLGFNKLGVICNNSINNNNDNNKDNNNDNDNNNNNNNDNNSNNNENNNSHSKHTDNNKNNNNDDDNNNDNDNNNNNKNIEKINVYNIIISNLSIISESSMLTEFLREEPSFFTTTATPY